MEQQRDAADGVAYRDHRAAGDEQQDDRDRRNVTKFSPMLPTSASPHVFFKSETKRPTAATGPTFSTTSTGTTKNVITDHAVPKSAAMISPTFSCAFRNRKPR